MVADVGRRRDGERHSLQFYFYQKIISIPIYHNNQASTALSANCTLSTIGLYFQMNRESSKKTTEDGQYQEQAKFLISNFRARENGLAIFLELFSIAGRSKVQSQQYRIYKQQFLEKQKIYTAQIRQIGEKLMSEMQTYSQIKHFWNKLKAVLRISQERIRSMGLLTESLVKRYEEVMSIVEGALEQGVQMKEFLRVEQLLRKRTVEALVTTKQLFLDHPLPDTIEANKNRSETFLKFNNKPTDSINFSPNNPKASHLREQGEASSMNKLKSITRVKKKGDKLRMQISQTQTKKGQMQRNRAQSAWQRYERVIADVMDCKFEHPIDKKKTKAENQDKLYDQLFDRNIANHKEIIKYSHSCTKLKAILTQLSKAQKNRLVSQKKLNCGARPQADPKPQKALVSRPKTSKKQKLPNPRAQSGQYQKLVQLKGAR